MKPSKLSSKKDLKNAIEKGVTLIDFNAPWCPPCRAQEPVMKELCLQFNGKALIAEMDIDENEENTKLSGNLGIKGIPTLIVFKNGKEIQRFVGLQNQNTLASAIEGALI